MATLITARWTAQIPIKMGIAGARDMALKIGRIAGLRYLQVKTTINQHKCILVAQSAKLGDLNERCCRDTVHYRFRDWIG